MRQPRPKFRLIQDGQEIGSFPASEVRTRSAADSYGHPTELSSLFVEESWRGASHEDQGWKVLPGTPLGVGGGVSYNVPVPSLRSTTLKPQPARPERAQRGDSGRVLNRGVQLPPPPRHPARRHLNDRAAVAAESVVVPPASGLLAAALVPNVTACSRRIGQEFTRGEMASLFGVSCRTVARWEQRAGLPLQRKNARVLRYPVDAVILLCARGVLLDRDRAVSLGLVPDIIFAVAARQPRLSGKVLSAPVESATNQNFILLSENDDHRRLIAVLRHPEKMAALCALIRVWESN